jgi:hypothetical protein
MVPFREILRGTAARFLPGAVLGQAAMIAVLLIGEPNQLHARDTGILALFTGLMAAGHLGALGTVRRALRDDADVTGRRALITGAAAGAIHFGVATAVGGMTVETGYPLAFLAGALAALGMFFPWIGVVKGDYTDGGYVTGERAVARLEDLKDPEWHPDLREPERVRRNEE